MGTIAFPNIAQDSATTAAQNSLAEYDRAAALRQQSAMEAQQTQALQLQNQQTQGVNQAYKDAFKPDATGNLTLDTNQLQQSLAQNGHGAAIPGIMKGITDYKKQMADLQDSQQKLQTGARDALGSLGYSLQQAKYDPQLAHTLIQDELNDPSIPAQTKQQLAQTQQQITQNPALIQSMADQWVAQSPAQQAKQIERQNAQSKATEAATEQQKANAADWKDFPQLGVSLNTRTGEQRSVGGGAVMPPGMMESKYVALQQKKNAGQPLDPSDSAWVKAYEKMKTLVPQFNIAMNASGAGLGPTASGSPSAGVGGGVAAQPSINDVPAAIRGRVQAALDYRQALPPQGRNNPINSAISEWTYKLDPQHDETNFPARNKLMTAFTSGKESGQINAVNTALGHVGVLSDAIDALNNGNIPVLNAIANKLGVAIGNTPATTVQTIVHRVGPELAAAYIQGGGGEGERGTTADDFSVNKGNNQLKANLAITAQLLRSKIGSLENQYKNTMGRDDFQQRFITPEAQSTLGKLSPNGGAQPQGGQKTLSLSTIQQAAKDHGVSLDEARRQAIAAGYTIQ